MLDVLQEKWPVTRDVPRPTVAAPPPAPKPVLPRTMPTAPASPNGPVPAFAMDLEAMKREARIMMGVFSKNGGPHTPDPAAAIRAVPRTGISPDRRASAS